MSAARNPGDAVESPGVQIRVLPCALDEDPASGASREHTALRGQGPAPIRRCAPEPSTAAGSGRRQWPGSPGGRGGSAWAQAAGLAGGAWG